MVQEQSRSHRRFVILFHLGCLVILLVCILIERHTDPAAIYADQIGQVRDTAEVRSELLMEAMQFVGPSEPLAAVQTWITGLMRRSGAIQYAVLSSELKLSYASCLTEQRPNWVTGQSSPWVCGYTLVSEEPKSDTAYMYELLISTKASEIPETSYQVTLHVVLEDGFWKISKISGEPELYVYIGCHPDSRFLSQ